MTTAAANYADDALLMMPNAPAMQGKSAIETGTFEWTLTPKSGAAMTDKGKYLTVWKKQADGTWKIIRDINNSDLPPAGAH